MVGEVPPQRLMINEGDNSGPHNRRPEDKPLEAIFQVQVATLPGLHSEPDQIPLPRILDWEHRRLRLEGAYNGAPIGTNNQPSTLEGVVDMTLLEYPNHTSYLSFFLHGQNFWKIKFTLKFTQ